MPGSFRQIIDRAVKEKRFLVVPGVHDALSARIAQQIGGSFGTAVLAVILEGAAGSLRGPAMARAFATSFEWTIGLTVIALLAALWLPARAVQPARSAA